MEKVLKLGSGALLAGVTMVLHYLDDSLTMGQKGSYQCAHNLDLMKKVCALLGFPLKEEKIEGPTAAIIFLGVLLDTQKSELRLPSEKMEEIKKIGARMEKKAVVQIKKVLQKDPHRWDNIMLWAASHHGVFRFLEIR